MPHSEVLGVTRYGPGAAGPEGSVMTVSFSLDGQVQDVPVACGTGQDMPRSSAPRCSASQLCLRSRALEGGLPA
jgi:predicted 3-demethylubiquinone-9 3-methyltransferase (glyoxalase superfamily)